MLSARAQAFSVRNLLAPLEPEDCKPPPPHLPPHTVKGVDEAQWSHHTPKCDLNQLPRSVRSEESCCDVDQTSLCRHPSVVGCTEKGGDGQTAGVRVELCQAELWQAFHALGTEMIITRSGRRMFPAIRLRMTGLEPSALYRLSLEFSPCGLNKYRYVYHSSRWMMAGEVVEEEKEKKQSNRTCLYPDCPILGQTLTSQIVTFDRVKLTNCACPAPGQVSLSSMQKFQPKIRIEKLAVGNGSDDTSPLRMTFIFPQTSFMAVTAYQNQQITRLKIARNPFAKGFRHAGKYKNSHPLSSSLMPVCPCWSEASFHCSTLPDDCLPWKHVKLDVQPPSYPGRGPSTAETTVYDASNPPDCFHPTVREWNSQPPSLPWFSSVQPTFPLSPYSLLPPQSSPLFHCHLPLP